MSDELRRTLTEGLSQITATDNLVLSDEAKLQSLDLDSLDFSELVIYLEEHLEIDLGESVKEIQLTTTISELVDFLASFTGEDHLGG